MSVQDGSQAAARVHGIARSGHCAATVATGAASAATQNQPEGAGNLEEPGEAGLVSVARASLPPLRRARPVAQRPPRSAPFQEWNAESGLPSAQFFHLKRGFLLRFPHIADFIVDATGARVRCIPVPGTGERWRAIHEQQVVPLLLGLHGAHVFHGGAVVVDGRAVAFLAPSGHGKSTLTAAFARRGFAFLTDDCLVLDLHGSAPLALPHEAHVRLWEDSVAVMGGTTAVDRRGSSKPRLAAGNGLAHEDQARTLAAIYLLGPGEAERPVVTPLPASQALVGLASNAFVLDITRREVLHRNLQVHARLVHQVQVRRLDYPRRYELLDDVVAAVLADLPG